MAREPERLRRGKAFHRLIQRDWEETAQGDVTREAAVLKPSGRRGRIDIHVDAGDGEAAVVEIKASDWDGMTDRAVRRNVRRQSRQIWSYLENQLERFATVSPGIVFPAAPSDAARKVQIEEMFLADGIAVVWQDE